MTVTALLSTGRFRMTGWLEYFVKGLAAQMKEVTEKGKKVIKKDLIVKQYALNDRQSLALGFLITHNEMHIRDMEHICSGVNRRTLQRDLRKMEELGLIQRRGAARQLFYSLKENML